MCRRTSGVFFDCFLNVRYSLAHVAIISTRSRTVQKVLVTPAAIAGVQRAYSDAVERAFGAGVDKVGVPPLPIRQPSIPNPPLISN
jgi:hypothetical protein